jgi:signal transduction histidine kinase
MVASPGDRVLIPIERELQERLAWFIRLRWLAAAGVFLGALAAAWVVQDHLNLVPVYAVAVSVLAYNIGFRLYLVRADKGARPLREGFVYAQIGLDWLALIFLVHYTGGIRSPVTLAFTIHIIIGAILLSRRSCYFLAASAASLTLIVAALEELGIWPLSTTSRLLADDARGIAAPFNLWVAVAIFFGVTAYLATSITQRLREKEEALFASERALDRAYREMEALYQLGQVVSSTLEMKEVLRLIAENATRLLGMKASFIRLFDPSGRKLYIGGSYGLSQEYLNKGPVVLEKSLMDKETLAGGIVQVLEVGDDTRFQYREEARREGLRSVLCLPLTAKHRVLGVIRVYSAEPHVFSDREQNLMKNLANLGALAIENAYAYAELKALSEQRVWFARVTHHQLRAPLAGIQSVLDALPYAGETNPKQKELVERGRRRVRDAFDLIRDLLDLAAAQRPLDEGASEDVVMSRALEQTVEAARERARGKGVELEVEMPARNLTVRAQAGDIERIFSNLLDNALKYTPSSGRVRFLVREVDGCVQAEVSDTGIGIDPHDQERIFEGFYRTEAAKNTGEMGTGLGLSIVKRLIDRWGGKLELDSTPGKGSRFVITFPCRRP